MEGAMIAGGLMITDSWRGSESDACYRLSLGLLCTCRPLFELQLNAAMVCYSRVQLCAHTLYACAAAELAKVVRLNYGPSRQ